MKLKFIRPKESASASKLTVHKTGKLGLSRGAINLLNVGVNKYCKFAFDENEVNENAKTIYILMSNVADDETFNISKAGDYYYIKAKSLLMDLSIDFTDEKKTVIFDIYPAIYDGEEIFKLDKREINRK